MAISATISLSSATVTVGQVVQCSITVSNSVATPVIINSIVPSCIFTGNTLALDGSSHSFGDIPLSQGFNNTVPASGSAVFMVPLSIYSPSTGLQGTGSGTYSVSCVVNSNDQQSVSPTAATITVNPVLPIF